MTLAKKAWIAVSLIAVPLALLAGTVILLGVLSSGLVWSTTVIVIAWVA